MSPYVESLRYIVPIPPSCRSSLPSYSSQPSLLGVTGFLLQFTYLVHQLQLNSALPSSSFGGPVTLQQIRTTSMQLKNGLKEKMSSIYISLKISF